MKRILLISSAAVVFAACNPKPDVTSVNPAVPTLDTAGLAQYQQWKVQNELQQTELQNELPTEASYAAAAPVAKRKTYAPARRSATSKNRSVSNESGTVRSETANTAKRSRVSKAAKGTAIGAAGGAVLGAVIHKKNRVVGGVVGGVLGGGVGYGIGRKMDKKDGRY